MEHKKTPMDNRLSLASSVGPRGTARMSHLLTSPRTTLPSPLRRRGAYGAAAVKGLTASPPRKLGVGPRARRMTTRHLTRGRKS
jgi:hypothetical protein